MFVEVGRLAVGDKFVYFGRRYRVESLWHNKVCAYLIDSLGYYPVFDFLKSQVVKVEA